MQVPIEVRQMRRAVHQFGLVGGEDYDSKVGGHIPRAPMTSIFEDQPLKTRPFPIKTRIIWFLGIYIYIVRYMIYLLI